MIVPLSIRRQEFLNPRYSASHQDLWVCRNGHERDGSHPNHENH